MVDRVERSEVRERAKGEAKIANVLMAVVLGDEEILGLREKFEDDPQALVTHFSQHPVSAPLQRAMIDACFSQDSDNLRTFLESSTKERVLKSSLIRHYGLRLGLIALEVPQRRGQIRSSLAS